MPTYTLERPTAALPNRRYNPKNPAVNQGVRNEFRALADWWHEATDVLSSPSQKVKHRAYQRIIGLREAAVPLILEDLRDHGGYWFYALERITGTCPRPKDRPATFATVRQAWLKWGSDQGFI
ncbi:MAG: hypothetical protein EXR51_05660 [Dehalococcoidia bacterium]|nr:hypothetical protein [Dehalococcoidia bacterium]